ncbi:hypothetical protein MGWOODY_Smn1069 [hydrothermal vent metagenome]|jgi:hypothetical protein|uniref:Uncharacterized protein n=1 Tax=hydrothermal vent metagenome TaxID=652676 RepID=A0A160THX5_9ZZZZ
MAPPRGIPWQPSRPFLTQRGTDGKLYPVPMPVPAVPNAAFVSEGRLGLSATDILIVNVGVAWRLILS